MRKTTLYFTVRYALIALVFAACAKNNDGKPDNGNAEKGGSGAPAIEWQKTFDLGVVQSIQQTTDGGYVFCVDNFKIVKLDPQGELQWQKQYGGLESTIYSESPAAIRQTKDGGYIVVGFTTSDDGDVSGHHGGRDFWVVKLDNSGNLQWQKSLGGSMNDVAMDVQQTSDGGYVVVGYSESNDGDVSDRPDTETSTWVVKLSNAGEMLWEKSFNNYDRTDEPSDWANSVQQTTDGGYILAGQSYGRKNLMSQETTCWITKLTEDGTLEWGKTLGGSWGEEDAWSIQQTTDNGYIMGGYTYANNGDVSGNHGYADYWVVKMNNSGDVEWQKCLGGTGLEMGGRLQQTQDGGYIVVGSAASNNGNVSGYYGGEGGDAWLVKLDAEGKIQWQKCYGGTDEDGARAIQQTSDGGYIMAGYGRSVDGDVMRRIPNDCWIVKLKF